MTISHGHVTKVDRFGTLVLADGRALHLEGILPADGASARLKQMTMRRQIVVAAMAPKLDRYSRIRAQAFSGDDWLQVTLLKQGLARVFIAPDRRECASALFAAEQDARANRAGLWADAAFAVRTPDTISARDSGAFEIVEGKILSANVKGGRAYLDFGTDWKRDFTATISPQGMKLFRALGLDPRTYAGAHVRVRGWVENFDGPEIEIVAPQDIEILQ